MGSFPCKITSEGVSDTYISCETTDSKSTKDILDLPVTVVSKGASDTSKNPFLVSYKVSKTPAVDAIYPTAGYASVQVKVEGGNSGVKSYGKDKDTGDV